MQISYREADQRLCFRNTDSTIPLLSKYEIFKPLAIFCSCTAWFVLDQVGNQNVGFLMTRLKCKKLIFISVGLSKDYIVQYQLNHLKYVYIKSILVSGIFSVTISYNFNFLTISEQIPKVPPFLKLGCKNRGHR